MSEEIGAIFIIIIIAFAFSAFGFFTGVESGKKNAINLIRQGVCKQLYQQNTNKYINCNSKEIYKNIELIKDITNDR